MPPQLIFGTATFGMDMTDFQDRTTTESLLKALQDLDIHRLDSGARYPPNKPGRAEELIGEIKARTETFVVDTKVYTDTQTDGSGDLTEEAIENSTLASLGRMKRADGVNVLHAHRADPSTPLEEQIRGFNRQIEQGRCKAWGVSNVPLNVLEKILNICEVRGYQKPSCYQGEYNLATRGMETKLLPLLHKHGMTFNAFRPLAAGFLTGKLTSNNHEGTRSSDEHPLGKLFQKLFSAEDLNAAMSHFDTEIKSYNLTPIEVAVRWIVHHSALGKGDGVIFGASKTQQIRETVAMIRKGPLDEEVLRAAEKFWETVRGSRGEIM